MGTILILYANLGVGHSDGATHKLGGASVQEKSYSNVKLQGTII